MILDKLDNEDWAGGLLGKNEQFMTKLHNR
jgi:hypothetical protein